MAESTSTKMVITEKISRIMLQVYDPVGEGVNCKA